MEAFIDKRPWGWERWFVSGKPVTVKILHIDPNARISLQKHNKYRIELWRILSGRAKVTLGQNIKELGPGEEVEVEFGMIHRLEAFDEPVEVLEIISGDFDEKDIIHIDDDYGRT
ncbi:MAG TPA: phosphomannose isomerase type II C-terminal cupin domain [Candidatus Paceibacterota bacterium]